jgi:hypothetical protein
MRRKAAPLAVMAIAGALLAGCQTDGTPSNPLSELAAYNGKKDEPKTAAKPPEPPMTRSRAAMECWMKTEKGTASGDLDKRADLVNKCIDDKLKGGDAPKT